MHERRTSRRVIHRCRAQSCPSEDLLPQEVYLTNLSDRGAGLLLRDTPQEGERVTVSFSLPGAEEPLTASGRVRWSGPRLRRGTWCPVGVEWLPLDEATRQPLRQFLSEISLREISQSPTIPRPWAGSLRGLARGAPRLALRAGIVGGVLLAGLLCGLWAFSLWRQNAQLRAILHVRSVTLQQIEQHDARLRDEMRAASAHLGVPPEEMARLSQQVQVLEGEAQQLGRVLSRVKESQAQLGRERDALMERVLALEQERLTLIQRSVPGEELELAIREAIARRVPHPWVIDENQGYLLWRGRNTTARSPLRIRVHEPELRPGP